MNLLKDKIIFFSLVFLIFVGLGFSVFAQSVEISNANPISVDPSFVPQISSEIPINQEFYLGRESIYTGPAIGTVDGVDTIKWEVTISGPSTLTPDMIDLDEVGFLDLPSIESNIATYHYPFIAQEDGKLIAVGSCDSTDTHEDSCDALIGFSLDENDIFTNADRIKFNSNAPLGVYTIKYELVNTEDDSIISNSYQLTVELIQTDITTADSTTVSEDFTPSISSNLAQPFTVYIGRETTYTGPTIGLGDPETIKWKVTIEGPSDFTVDMVDLDEVGWKDLTDLSIATYHYPFTQIGNEFVALGSCDDVDIHDDNCDKNIGFSLVENDKFTNVDKIEFNSNAPLGKYTIRYELVNTVDGKEIVLSNAYEVTLNLILVTISNSNEFTLGETTFEPVLSDSIYRNTNAYYYSVNSLSSIVDTIPNVQWKITVEGPEGSELTPAMIDLDEVGWKDVLNEPNGHIENFHYPFVTQEDGSLVATGSCDTADVHSNECDIDTFDVDPSDNFINIDTIKFDLSAPKGEYTIRRQLVDSNGIVSNELEVAKVTVLGEGSEYNDNTEGTNLMILPDLEIKFDNLSGGTADVSVVKYNKDEINEDNNLPTSLYGFLNSFYDINSDNLNNGEFSVTLTFNYLDADQDGFVDGTSPSLPETSLKVMFFNVNSGNWEELSGEVIDAVANTISVTTDHFTLFSIVSTYVSPSTPTTTGGGGGGGPAGTKATGAVITPPTPTPERVVPTGETPAVTTPTTLTTTPAPTGLTGITGAVVGALGTGGAIIVLILAIGGIGTGSYFLFRKKK